MRSRPRQDRVVHRSARMGLRLTPAQARRCYGLLRAGGDVWAALIELNGYRFRRRARPVFGYAELCRQVAGTTVGELSVTALRSVIKRYAEGCAETARRKRRGERARYPRRRRALVPLRWYSGTFNVTSARVLLSMAKGCPSLSLRLSRTIPYPVHQLRSVTLLSEAGRLYLDVTAEVPVEENDVDPSLVAGVDPGIIHPYAVVASGAALLVSGRAIRAEERLHLADTKVRAARMGRKTHRRGQRGSRRWRKLAAAQRKAEARHRRRVRQAHHEAAGAVVAWAVGRRVGTLVVGHPKGITSKDAGRRQNRRLRQWRRVHLTKALTDKATRAVWPSSSWTSEARLLPVQTAGPGWRPRGGCFAVLPVASEPIATWWGPPTSPPKAAEPRAFLRSSPTVGLGPSQHGVTAAVISWTPGGPARLRAARGHPPGVARRGRA